MDEGARSTKLDPPADGPATDAQREPAGAHSAPPGASLSDRFGRSKKKLRLSLTDRCNYRCLYCMPEEPAWKPRAELLSFEELYALARVLVARLGIEQIRLTGGEPLMRRGAAEFVAMLQDLRPAGLRRVSMTTNGVLLKRYARALAEARLDDLNVSLDSLSPERFARLSGGGDVSEVVRGIERARAAGLPVKVNAVVIRGENDRDILALAQWACARHLALRFIEFMPLDGRGFWAPARVVGEREIVACLKRRFEVSALPHGRDPATCYLLDGAWRLGIISTVSNPFCASCDRLRLVSDGRLFPCLFSPTGTDLRAALRAGSDGEVLERLIRQVVWNKPRGFVEIGAHASRQVSMHLLGG